MDLTDLGFKNNSERLKKNNTAFQVKAQISITFEQEMLLPWVDLTKGTLFFSPRFLT